MTEENLGHDLGRLFEVGFNVGILTYIEQHQINHNFGDLYRQDLSKLSFPKILRRLADKEQVTSEQHRHIAEKWSTFFLQKGFLAGLNFFGEYIKSTGWNKRQLKRLQILYYQCCFSDDNSIGTYPKGRDRAYKEVLSQFGDLIDIGKYDAKKGEFLNADTLMLLQRGGEIRVLCVDLSVFSIKTIRDLVDVDSVEVIKSILLSEISYIKSKSVFSNLGLDTKNLGLNFNQDLARYFTAFKREDKETVKLIQAASYTYSFYEFLRSRHLIADETSVIFNVVGYSDRSINAMSLTEDNLQVLATCANIYKQESSDRQINAARKEVLNLIRRNAAKSFKDGKEFINRLLEVPANKITLVTHQERIDDFFNSIDTIPPDLAAQLQLNPNLDLRNAHKELIKRELASDSLYIFLTGNPGIGKTTAIAEVLKSQECMDDGFLLFYVSPRTQVNLDIIEKFIDGENLCSDRLFTINTDSNLIKKHGGRCTVNYISNLRQEDFIEKTVHFIDQRDNVERYAKYSTSLKRTKEDRIQDLGQKNRGVLDSICEAIYTIIDRNISNNIIATVSIQSLKKTQGGKDTLEHFEKIFKNAYKERDGLVIPAEMQKISSRIKHLFIMIDEITGDDSGVEFLSRISSILHKYELTDSRHGFNTKIIVADASIVDKNVIQQHLLEKSAEPNKIFFRRASGKCSPLSVEYFNFNEFHASVINTNSYPAKSLNIKYKVLIESVKFSQKAVLKRDNNLRKRVKAEIVHDINDLLQHPDTKQIIVYVQDKPRLAELIQNIRDDRGEFQPYTDYLEIHSNLSEKDKKDINKDKNDVKVIFMTASASRGLSFPKTKHILVDIPRFEIEKNLMEIIQVIYRGRGGYTEDGIDRTLDNEEKEIVFYLSERSVYYVKNDSLSSQDYAEEYELSLQESVLNILNLLLILKASIMTRISGYGQVGQDNYIIIPIGGKSVIAAGQTFSGKMTTLIKQLKKEHYRQPYNQQLREVSTSLEQLLSRADFILRSTDINEEQGVSYLSLRESFTTQFKKLVNNGFEGLLSFTPIETGYISGSLIVIPVAGILEESYEMRLEQEIFKYANSELLEKMDDIRRSSTTPESLRSALNDAIELVELLHEERNKTQRFEQNSQRFDQYYALPLFTFLSGEAMSQYFASNEEEPEDRRFRDILDIYIQSLYPVGNILPISHKYIDFPFIIFNSYSLNEMRSKLFTDKYLLTSNELNVLNLILSQRI